MAFKIVDKKRFMLVIAIIAVLLGLLIFFGVTLLRNGTGKESGNGKQEERIYEALVQTKGKDNYENEEDKKTFFENGDVMAVFPQSHPWTRTEKEELIVKIKLTDEDAKKLLEGETKLSPDKVPGSTEASEDKKTETILLRKWKIDLNQIESKEPDKVYGEGVITGK